jgi:hypothetical protein
MQTLNSQGNARRSKLGKGGSQRVNPHLTRSCTISGYRSCDRINGINPTCPPPALHILPLPEAHLPLKQPIQNFATATSTTTHPILRSDSSSIEWLTLLPTPPPLPRPPRPSTSLASSPFKQTRKVAMMTRRLYRSLLPATRETPSLTSRQEAFLSPAINMTT